jgi:hypothetical protein
MDSLVAPGHKNLGDISTAGPGTVHDKISVELAEGLIAKVMHCSAY